MDEDLSLPYRFIHGERREREVRIRESDLIQGLRVYGVAVEGSEIFVDLYGGLDDVHSVCFTFVDRTQRRDQVTRLRRWQRDATVCALLRYGTTTSLLSEEALVARALDGVLGDD